MKNVLVVGATSGIAKSTLHVFSKNKYNLVIAGRDMNEMGIIANDLMIRYQNKVTVEFFDALDYQSHDEFFKNCTSVYGALDGILLAYGFMGDQRSSENEFEIAKKTIETNFTSAVSILNIAAAYFESNATGFICAITSVAGDRGRQSNYTYGAAKGALNIYLQGLRNRLFKANVQVLTIKPGFVDTKMTYGILKNSPLVAHPDKVASRIYKAILRKKDVAYIPGFWFFIMTIIKVIPEIIFKRLKL